MLSVIAHILVCGTVAVLVMHTCLWLVETDLVQVIGALCGEVSRQQVM